MSLLPSGDLVAMLQRLPSADDFGFERLLARFEVLAHFKGQHWRQALGPWAVLVSCVGTEKAQKAPWPSASCCVVQTFAV